MRSGARRLDELLAKRWLRLAVVGLVGAAALGQANPAPSPSLKDECAIAGLAVYAIQETTEGSCTENTYIRACNEAQRTHRERCRGFCASFKSIHAGRVCLGSSKPTAQLFDTNPHCVETRRDQFRVTCTVAAVCTCAPGDPG